MREHQKATIYMFTKNGLDPVSIIKALQDSHGGIQALLLDFRTILQTAEVYEEVYGLDIVLLIQLFKQLGQNVFEGHLNDLMQMSHQGLLQPKQDDVNGTTPAEPPTDEELELSHMGDERRFLAKPAGKRLNSTSLRTNKTPTSTELGALAMGKRPFSSSAAAKELVPPLDPTGKRRVISHICAEVCTKYMKKQYFINHARLNHMRKIPSGALVIKCCGKSYGDEVAYLDHQWDKHSKVLPMEDNKAGATPREDRDTSCLSAPASGSDTGY
ncbi:hypothetical protein SLS60_005244 [Paraconiothyrium brasiliense]|uniref:C2H2-type domain-containing protein n=1 Tax=Paraconiothyrium brasiliense TaxID=300254 RepID=A0ABR3RGT2_9PLEO